MVNRFLFVFIVVYIFYAFSVKANSETGNSHFNTEGGPGVTITDNIFGLRLDNGIVSVFINRSTGTITKLNYKDLNLLADGYSGGKIYWSWNMPGYQNPSGCSYAIVADPDSNNGDFAEVKFHMTWDGTASQAAMDVDIYYSLPRGTDGIYASAELSHPASYPANPGGEFRLASYVGSMFDWLSVDSLRNRKMASQTDWQNGEVPSGAPKEVELLHSGIYNNQYECKYDYSADFGDIDVWGWSSSSKNIGIWITAPSKEYYNGGPMKRELTGHVGPTLLNMFNGQHYGMGTEGSISSGESWKKIFGPFLIYCDSVAPGTSDANYALWEDAKAQAKLEQDKWPYEWFTNPDYVKKNGRGTITGKLVINDPMDSTASSANMWIGAAIPPEGTSSASEFQKWSKNYQFWVKTDKEGKFSISNVLPGTYNLYAFGPGVAGQMTKTDFATVTAGNFTDLGNVVWVPERVAPTVLEIGMPDRTAKEFKHGSDWWTSNIYPNTHWAKFLDYYDEFPDGVDFTFGKSPDSAWNFVQYYAADKNAPEWNINFTLTDDPLPDSTAALYIAYAANYNAASIVKVNGTLITSSSGIYPPNKSNAMIRKGIHGAFGDHRFTFPANLLHAGENKITLLLRITGGASYGQIMYDYIRLEAWGTAEITGINESVDLKPKLFKLYQNYPNPFNPTTTIKYSIPGRADNYSAVQLKVFNLLGQQVAVLVNEEQAPGNYQVKFNGSGLASGIYIYTIKIGNGSTQSRKLVLLK